MPETEFLRILADTQNDVAAVELDLKALMHVVAERTQKLTCADGAIVETLCGDCLQCNGVSGVASKLAGRKVGLNTSLAGLVVREGKELYCADAGVDPRVDRSIATAVDCRSFLIVPIVHNQRIAGALCVCTHAASAFGPRDVLGLRMMAGLIAAALVHAEQTEARKKLLADRTDALAALRESEERFHSAFDHAAIGMAIVALDGRWTQVNRSLCRLIGYTEHELLVRDFQSVTHPDDLNADLAQIRRLLQGEVREYQMIKRYLHRQGRVVWVLLSVSLVRSVDGNPLHFISQIQDITHRKEMEDALRLSEDEYRTTFELSPVGKAQVDLATMRFARVNRKLCEILGRSANVLKTMTLTQVTAVEDRPAQACDALSTRERVLREFNSERRFTREDGRTLWLAVSASVIEGAQGEPARAVFTFQDVTERKLSQELERDRRQILEMVTRDTALPQTLSLLAAAVEKQVIGSVAAVLVLEAGIIRIHGPSLAPAWHDALGRDALSLASGLAVAAWDAPDNCGVTYLSSDAIWKSHRALSAQLGVQTCWTTAIKGSDSAALGLLTIFSRESRRPTTAEVQTLDMAAKLASICIEHHNTTRQLSHLVRHDPLTGLPNRILFEDRIHHAMELARRSGRKVGVLLLDVDRFKSINDTFGHQFGDQLLHQFALRLSSLLRVTDTMARLGGDEFAIVLPEIKSREDAEAVAQKLVSSLTAPFTIGERTFIATSSIGVAMFPDDGDDSVRLQKRADEAMYRVKQLGRNKIAVLAAATSEAARS